MDSREQRVEQAMEAYRKVWALLQHLQGATALGLTALGKLNNPVLGVESRDAQEEALQNLTVVLEAEAPKAIAAIDSFLFLAERARAQVSK